jgi:hypothetical protein
MRRSGRSSWQTILTRSRLRKDGLQDPKHNEFGNHVRCSDAKPRGPFDRTTPDCVREFVSEGKDFVRVLIDQLAEICQHEIPARFAEQLAAERLIEDTKLPTDRGLRQ